DIEAAARDHWHEEVRLDGSAVVVPPHIVTGYEKLKAAGLLCLMVDPAYGGYGLPSLVNCVFMEMLSRADPSLMTIVGLQAGVALDVQKYGTEELKRRYLPRFASGELQGCMDLTEPQAGSDLGGILTRLGVAAQAIGIAEAAYRAARQYAAERVQFGTPIIEQPLVKSMLTLMAINIQAARALLYRTCGLIDMTEAIRRELDGGPSAGNGNRAALQTELEHNVQLIRFFTP